MPKCSKCYGTGKIPVIGTFTIPCGCGVQIQITPPLLKASTVEQARQAIKALGLQWMFWLGRPGSTMFGPDPGKCYLAVEITSDLRWFPWGHGEELVPFAAKSEILDWMLEYLTLDTQGRLELIRRYKRMYAP